MATASAATLVTSVLLLGTKAYVRSFRRDLPFEPRLCLLLE